MVHLRKLGEELRLSSCEILPNCDLCVTPGLICIFRKGPSPAPTSPWSIAEAQVLAVLKDAGESLRDDVDVGGHRFHFSRKAEVTMNQVLHSF